MERGEGNGDIMQEIIVGKREEGMRLDRYLQRYLPNAEKNFIYKMLRKKNIKLNGERCNGSEKICANDSIAIYFSDETLEKFRGRGAAANAAVKNGSTGKHGKSSKCGHDALRVIYEDDDILVVDKPAGMLSQKAERDDVSLVEHVTQYLLDSQCLTADDLNTFHPGVCNRLDRNTSGLVVAGKTLKGLQTMSEAFRDRTLHKYYIAVVAGTMEERMRLSGWLYRDSQANLTRVFDTIEEAGRLGAAGEPDRIETEFIPIAGNGRHTLLKINLITGKTHQIRAHLSGIGHGIVGDPKYGNRRANELAGRLYGVKRQLLHAYELDYPAMGLHLVAQVPPDFVKLLEGEGLWEPGIQEALGALH